MPFIPLGLWWIGSRRGSGWRDNEVGDWFGGHSLCALSADDNDDEEAQRDIRNEQANDAAAGAVAILFEARLTRSDVFSLCSVLSDYTASTKQACRRAKQAEQTDGQSGKQAVAATATRGQKRKGRGTTKPTTTKERKALVRAISSKITAQAAGALFPHPSSLITHCLCRDRHSRRRPAAPSPSARRHQ